MRKLEAASIDRWFSEDDVFGAHLEVLQNVLGAPEPDEVCHAVTIREVSHQHAVALTRVSLLITQNLSLNLHVWHVGGELADVEYLRTIYVFIWEVFQQVTIRVDTKFFAQYLFRLGSHVGQELDVLI